MKIAVIAPSHLPARRANTVQVMKMSNALADMGQAVRLYAPGIPQPKPGWDELARHHGLQTRFEVEWLPAIPSLRRYDFSYRALRRARRWGADLVYTRLPQAAALASLTRLGTIYEVHDLPVGVTSPFLFRRFLKGDGARRLVVITRALAADLHARLNAPLAPPFTLVAPDGVDLARYRDLPDPQAARRELFARHGWRLGFTAGYTGHFYPGRGADLLMELAAHLPEVSFVLVGGEPQDVARLLIQVESRGLTNLYLGGFVPNVELPLYQAACDLLLMPYQVQVAASSGGDIGRYLSPMKMFEYLACGRAILSSDLPVLREVLNPANALLLPPGEVGAWVGAVESLHADPARCAALGEQARRDAGSYTWERRAGRILEGLER